MVIPSSSYTIESFLFMYVPVPLRFIRLSMDNWNSELKNIVNQFVIKIYAHIDGSCTVNMGVHIIAMLAPNGV